MSESFQPSAAAAARALGDHARIVTRDHPVGATGASLSLDEVARRIREGRLDPRVRAWAGKVLLAAGKPVGAKAQAQAILDALKAQTVAVDDPVGSEVMVAAKNTLCLADGELCIPAGDCFPTGTLLLRDDYALVRIDDIKVGDRIWGFDKWTTVQAKAHKGSLILSGIFLNNGSVVQLTSDHHVFVGLCDRHNNRTTTPPCACPWEERRIERITVAELKEGMVLAQPKRLPFGKGTMDPDRAYIEGLFISDGWSTTETSFCISGQDGCPKEEQKRKVQAICERLGIETRWHRKSIVIKDREWTQRIHEMGHYAPEKHALSLDLDEGAAANLLRGIMADSGANTNGNGRTFTSTSKVLTTQTRVLHKMFGMACGSTFIEKHGGLGKNPIWRLYVRDKNTNRVEKILRVKDVHPWIDDAECLDIQTEDGYVYLPEHDVTVSNCDDMSIAVGSALMAIGIPVKVVGQSFDLSGVPTHVLIAIDSGSGWLRIDPRYGTKVGEATKATHEVWIDPLEAKHMTNASGQLKGDYVGVGAVPAAYEHPFHAHTHVGMGSILYSALRVNAELDRTNAAAKVVDDTFATCATTSPSPSLAAWQTYYAGWQAFYDDTYYSDSLLAQIGRTIVASDNVQNMKNIQAYQDGISAWQSIANKDCKQNIPSLSPVDPASIGNVDVPGLTPNPPNNPGGDSIANTIKWIVIGAASITGIVVLAPLLMEASRGGAEALRARRESRSIDVHSGGGMRRSRAR